MELLSESSIVLSIHVALFESELALCRFTLQPPVALAS